MGVDKRRVEKADECNKNIVQDFQRDNNFQRQEKYMRKFGVSDRNPKCLESVSLSGSRFLCLKL